jgi:ABC-type proline/glycine betaine transport system permease subunit
MLVSLPITISQLEKLIALPLVVVYCLLPDMGLQSVQAFCIFRALTRHECWGCGMTRALHALLHFDFPTALHHNILAAPVLIILATVWLRTVGAFVGPGGIGSCRTLLQWSRQR